MSDKSFSDRQEQILFLCQVGRLYSLSELGELLEQNFVKGVSAPTLRRDVARLVTLDFLRKTGDRKFARYSLNPTQLIHHPIDAHRYCSLDVDVRPGNSGYNFDLLKNLPKSLFKSEELVILQKQTKRYLNSTLNASPTIRKKELERFVVELSWKSSKIEGNTYTLLDTELLIREGIEAAGHTREEAIMILNHKKAFNFILDCRTDFSTPRLSIIFDLHRLLVTDLDIAFGLRKRLIGITGSVYRPPSLLFQIEEACEDLLSALSRLTDPYSRALLMLAAISYIQPFEDGNKRTARLAANAILLAGDCAPLSYRSVSELAYREAILVFYEKNSLLPLKDIFLAQYSFACENYLRFV